MRARIGLIVFALICVAAPMRTAAAAGIKPSQVGGATTTTVTAPTTTEAATTTVPTTTTTEPTTTSVAPTTTSSSSTTTSSTTTTSTTTPTTTTVAGSGSGTSSGTIALIVAALVAALVIIGMVVFLLRRRRRQQWRLEGRGAAAEASSLLAVLTGGLAALNDPATAARTWSDVESRGAHLHARLQGLAATAPDAPSRAAIAGVDRDLQALRAGVDADRALRLGPPPPTAEQLGYSSAVLRQRAADFEQAVADFDRLLTEPV